MVRTRYKLNVKIDRNLTQVSVPLILKLKFGWMPLDHIPGHRRGELDLGVLGFYHLIPSPHHAQAEKSSHK